MSGEDRERWDARWSDAAPGAAPHPFVVAQAGRLPVAGRALDVAGGAGRHGIWLASRDLDVTVVDVSPVGLALARDRATEAGVRVATLERDLDVAGLPPGPWDVVVVVGFLHRPTLDAVPNVLALDGVFVMVHPTERNLERRDRPPRRFLLDEGELSAIARGWRGCDVIVDEEGWDDTDRHTARVVVRRGGATPAGGAGT